MIKEIKNIIKKRREFISLDRIKFNVNYYKPKRNKFKVGLLFGLIGVCLITPATNWLIPISFKIINKFNPIWIYK